MKKILLLALSITLALAGGASAQNTAPFFDFKLNVSEPQLDPVAGNPDIWILKPGHYKMREVLELLAQKGGGKAIFADDFGVSFLQTNDSITGMVSDIIERLMFGRIATGKLGPDWLFVRIKSKTPVLPAFSLLAPRKRTPFEFNFNANSMAKPVDPKTLPPGAKSFEFNGDRVYHVPMQPNKK